VGGIVAYSPDLKHELLSVSYETLEKYGPVSEETAREMAIGVRQRLGADYGVSLTGNAGPTSDIDGKPVGLVFVAVAGPTGCKVECARFRGTREDVRTRTSQLALALLRQIVLGSEGTD
jgi:nicotinamide-nucleotide amidase